MNPHANFAGFGHFRVAALLTSLLLPGLAGAAPAITSVSGTIAHGQALSVAGAGFGSRTSYNNINDTWKSGQFLNFRFKDFEDGNLNSDGFYAQRADSNWSPSSSELGVLQGGPANSSFYMRRAYVSTESGGISAMQSGAGNQLYTTFKFMINANSQSGKLWRVYADSPQNNVYLATGCSDTLIRGYSECTAGSCSASTEWGTGPAFQPGRWHRVEVYADGSTNTFSVSMDGVQTWSKNNWLATSLMLNGHTLDYPNMIDSPGRGCGSSGAFSFDDIFVDFTRARVELGDAPTWSAVRKKEVQIPVSWSSGSIEIRLNAGEFSVGQTAYLYVVDPQGGVNGAGYPVIIGGSSTTPRPPADVSVR